MRGTRIAAVVAVALTGTVAGASMAWSAYTDSATLDPPWGRSGLANLATYQCSGVGRIWEHSDNAMTYELSGSSCSYVQLRVQYTSANGNWSGWTSWIKDPISAGFSTSGEVDRSQHTITR